VGFADEMRLGLRGQVRRVLAPRGVKVVQRLQLEYQWLYLLLLVDPLKGELRWQWIPRLRQEYLRPVLEAWNLAGVVWDGAGAHKGKQLADLQTQRVPLPPYSPELNPAERVFEEVRREVEGRVYGSLRDKQQVVEEYLRELAAAPEKVRQLCGWSWVREALEQLPFPLAP
jgi:transposase